MGLGWFPANDRTDASRRHISQRITRDVERRLCVGAPRSVHWPKAKRKNNARDRFTYGVRESPTQMYRAGRQATRARYDDGKHRAKETQFARCRRMATALLLQRSQPRSEERRVGKECR